MPKPKLKPKPNPNVKGPFRRNLFFINLILILIPLTYFGYSPILRKAGKYLVITEDPKPADAIVVLAGGDAARPYEAVQLFRKSLAKDVLITMEPPPRMYDKMKKDGVTVFLPYENYARVLSGYGVPREHILTLDTYVADTLDELRQVRRFADQRGWKKVIVVTSNFHTRRAKLVTEYVLQPDIQAQVVSSGAYDSFDPDEWWKSQADIRTFAIEFEKLITYTFYIGPRLLLRRI